MAARAHERHAKEVPLWESSGANDSPALCTHIMKINYCVKAFIAISQWTFASKRYHHFILMEAPELCLRTIYSPPFLCASLSLIHSHTHTLSLSVACSNSTICSIFYFFCFFAVFCRSFGRSSHFVIVFSLRSFIKTDIRRVAYVYFIKMKITLEVFRIFVLCSSRNLNKLKISLFGAWLVLLSVGGSDFCFGFNYDCRRPRISASCCLIYLFVYNRSFRIYICYG